MKFFLVRFDSETTHTQKKKKKKEERASNSISFFVLMDFVVVQAQHERQDNCSLRAENDKIRCENIAIREALKNIICPNCGGPPVTEDYYFDDQKLRMENARLKDEVDP